MSKGKSGGIKWLIAVILVGGAIIYNQNPSLFSKGSRNQSSETRTPVITSTPSPVPTATPKPVNASNGQIFINPDYEQMCNLTLKASSSSNHYIYLEYKSAPANSANKRSLKSNASSPYESDIAFYVAKGSEATVQVPIGVYKFYYASGDTFFGKKLLFGDGTRFFSSDDYLTFYTDEEKIYGHTITLTAVVNGNFDTDSIPESEFPGR